MAFSFGGEFGVKKSPEEVYDFLTDPNRFAPLLPDFQGLTVEDARNFTVKVKVGVSHIRGTAAVKMQLVEAKRPTKAVYRGSGGVVGGNVNMTAGFELEPNSEGTRVRWKGEAQVFGPIISIAGGLLEPLAKKNVQKLINGLQAALA
ncbi:MAG: SRPBCC family protein [Acidobacteria bacterium]|nr:SRPBCC family protein [Acidobacteriota bacterium]